MPDCLLGEVVALVPHAGALVQDRNQVRPLGEQVRPEYVGEQVVVAVPLPTIIQGHDEQVGALQGDEQVAPVRTTGDGITERTGEPVEDRGVQQELADLFGLSLQYLLHEVVDDVPVVSGELGDESADVGASLHGERGQLECGDPAFGPAFQRGDVVGGEVETGDVVEVGGDFVGGEAQVGGADLDQLAAGPQPGEWQERVGAAADHQVDVRWEVLQEERHVFAEVWSVDEVVVVEYEVDVVRGRREFVEHGGEDGRDRRLGRLQECERFGSDAGHGCL